MKIIIILFFYLIHCSVNLDGPHLGITLDDDIDIITSQGDTEINIPSDVPTGRREVLVSKSGESGGLGISIKVTISVTSIES